MLSTSIYMWWLLAAAVFALLKMVPSRYLQLHHKLGRCLWVGVVAAASCWYPVSFHALIGFLSIITSGFSTSSDYQLPYIFNVFP